MRPMRGSWWCCALAAALTANGTVSAAWNNVFQVCCHNCRSSNYVAAVPAVPAAPAPCGCPQQTCTTRYVQRCYYQPVVTYKQSCYLEPVTSYRTSYYYAPITTVRYSCYYDPCTCRYQQVAQPVTSYQLRSQCCPVTSYLQRCCLQPVTSYQQAFYYEPVTTCCTTSVGAPVAALPPGATATPMVPAPGVSSTPGGPQPGVSSQPLVPQPQPGVSSQEAPGPSQNMKFNPNYGNGAPRMPYVAPGSSYSRQPQLRAPEPAVRPTAPTRDPRVRFDRITADPKPNAAGQVVRADRVPRKSAQVLFVNAERSGDRRTITTDHWGRFQTTLADGTWLVYVPDASGRLVYQQKVHIGGGEKPVQPMTLVSR